MNIGAFKFAKRKRFELFVTRAQKVAALKFVPFRRQVMSYSKFEDIRFLVEVWHSISGDSADQKRHLVQMQIEKIRGEVKKS